MKIALISGSRSDRNALVMVEKALRSNDHSVRTIDVSWPDEEEDIHGPIDSAVSASLNVNGILDKVMDSMNGGETNPWWPWKGDTPLIVVHGDRHEILGAVVGANIMGWPIAHIGGGDITEGSQDDCFRHAITKLSHLHFASNQDSADRIVQMGEEPDRVHVTGCPGIDMVMATPTLNREDTFIAVGLGIRQQMPTDYGTDDSIAVTTPARSLVVLFHPNTLDDTASELEALSVALSRRTEALVLLGPNADAGNDLIRREWQRLAQNRADTVYHDNVEPQVFYSLLKWCDVLIGNSSAGFYEAPCFGTKVLDIGDRQHGRLPHTNMFGSYSGDHREITACLDQVITAKSEPCVNPYSDGHASERIAKVICGINDPRTLLRKKFNEHREWCTAVVKRRHLPNMEF